MIFLSNILQFMVLIPAAILAILPVRNQFKLPVWKVFLFTTLTLIIIIPCCAIIMLFADIPINCLLLPVMTVLFLCYNSVLKSSFGVNLSLFLLIITLMSFPANFSLAIDSQIHPTETLADACILATAWQLVLSFVFLLLFSGIFYYFLGKLVDCMTTSMTWLATLPVPIIFFLINIMMQPKYYETMHTNRIFSIYICYHFLAILLLIIIYAIFYLVAIELIRSNENKERIRLFEMQESQYLAQQRYMMESARLRHDFRQQLNSMAKMAQQKEYEALTSHILNCVDAMPDNVTTYCTNIPVNALFHYYASLMKEADIPFHWNISLPTSLRITDIELCSLLGNILENVYYACSLLPKEQRYHNLTVCLRHENNLYIVSANSFNGAAKKKNGNYLSTHKGGSGIGLNSIATIAEKYNGMAQFSNTDKEFMIDVVLGQ